MRTTSVPPWMEPETDSIADCAHAKEPSNQPPKAIPQRAL
ncbi:MAG: hypothetical protein GAK34_01470 [Delftia tsuruhatensis]|nr:MAG: hypothetical protein GAK34_01470 [Delftia tsuruhatensis]